MSLLTVTAGGTLSAELLQSCVKILNPSFSTAYKSQGPVSTAQVLVGGILILDPALSVTSD